MHVVRGGDAKLASKLATPASEEALDEAIAAAAVRGADVRKGGRRLVNLLCWRSVVTVPRVSR